MKALKRHLAILVFAAAGFAAFAADAAGEKLTLATARSLALSNSKTLASLELSTANAVLTEKLQLYDTLPSVSAGASSSVSTPTSSGSTVADSLTASVSATVSQTVFDGGKNSLLAAIDAMATSSAKESARAEYFSVLDSIDSAWYSLMEAYASRDAAQVSIDASDIALSIAKVRLETGAISSTDYLEAESDAAANETTLSQARRDIAVYSLKVASLTGLAKIPAVDETDFSAYGALVARLAAFTESDAETFVANVRAAVSAGNPTLANATIAGAKSEKSVSLAAVAYLPTVNASVAGNLGYSASDGDATPDATVTLSASLSLDAWKTAASVSAAKIASKQSALSLAETERTLDINLQTAVYDCLSAARSVVSTAKALEYAQKHYANELEMYKLSSASVSDLSDAATLVSTNSRSLTDARYGFLSDLSTLRSLAALDSDAKTLDLIP